jgi:uncharacterized protein (DUF302 family)
MFYSEKDVPAKLEDVLFALLTHLKKAGYVVVADINVKNILKNALNYDFKDYHILEICNPIAAREIIGEDDLNGLFVPCKLTIYQEQEVTKIRMLRATLVTDTLLPKASVVIGKYERDLLSVLNSFSM